MSIEEFKGLSQSDDIHFETREELLSLKNELSPYSVNEEGDYVVGAFDEYSTFDPDEYDPNKFDQDTLE